MKILFICSLYTPHIVGGAEITLRTLVQVMKSAGNEVVVLSLGDKSGLACEEIDGIKVWRAGISNIYFPYGEERPPALKRKVWHLLDIYNPLVKPYIREVLENEKPDVASCHNLYGWSIAAWDVLDTYGVPIVQVLHDKYLLCPASTMFRNGKPCQKQCKRCQIMRLPHARKSNKVKAVVGVSRYLLDKVLSYELFQNVEIKACIHNIRKFERTLEQDSVSKKDNTVTFGFIGTLAPNKGIEYLLSTFIRHAKESWRLRVAGSGNLSYERYLRKTYRDPRISFLGKCVQSDFFPTVDVTIVPSMWEEPLGMVVAESMLFGVPVIGSDRGGIPEMISHGRNGLLFDPLKPASLVDSMNRVEEDLDIWRQKGAQISEGADAFRDEPAWLKKWLNVYFSAMKAVD